MASVDRFSGLEELEKILFYAEKQLPSPLPLDKSQHEKEMEHFCTLFNEKEATDLSLRLLERDATVIDEIRKKGGEKLSESFLENLQNQLGLLVTDDETCLRALSSIQKALPNSIPRRQRRSLDFFLKLLSDPSKGDKVPISPTHFVGLQKIGRSYPEYRNTISACLDHLLEEPEEES